MLTIRRKQHPAITILDCQCKAKRPVSAQEIAKAVADLNLSEGESRRLIRGVTRWIAQDDTDELNWADSNCDEADEQIRQEEQQLELQAIDQESETSD